MKKKIIILCMIFLILFFPILIITMSNNQSLDVKFLEEKYGDNYDEIIIYLENKIKDKNISKKNKGTDLLLIIYYSFINREYDKCHKYFYEAEEIIKEKNMNDELNKLYYLISKVYKYENNYSDLYVILYKHKKLLDKLYEKTGDEKYIVDNIEVQSLSSLSETFMGVNPQEDIYEVEKFVNENNSIITMPIYFNLSEYYLNVNNHEKAKYYSVKALEKYNGEKLYLDIYICSKLVLVNSYIKLGEFENASEAIKELDKNNYDAMYVNVVGIIILKGKLYCEMGNKVMGNEYFKLAYNETSNTLMKLRILSIVMSYNNSEEVLGIVRKRYIEDLNELDIMNQFDIISSQIGNINEENSSFEIKILNMQRYILILIIIIIILFIYIYRKKSEIKNDILQNSIEKLNKQIKYERKSYESIIHNDESIRRLRHDSKQHYIYVMKLIDDKMYDEAKEYLINLNNIINEYENNVITKNKPINAILTYKKAECIKKEIDINIDIKINENIPIDDFDLCIIFGNLLDNAIEACSKINNLPKEIFIKVRMQNNIIYIYVENTSYKYPKKIDGKFITSKKNKGYHGIGIESVRKSVEKYNGHLDFNYDNNMFRTKIIINI